MIIWFFAFSEKGTRKKKCKSPVGSDASAAGGRRSELSEWQRSIADAVASATRKISGTATGSDTTIS